MHAADEIEVLVLLLQCVGRSAVDWLDTRWQSLLVYRHYIMRLKCGFFCCSALGDQLWIGLTHDGDLCSCTDTTSCELCRQFWQWDDGSSFSWWGWHELTPQGYGCGYLSVDGWIDSSCRRSLPYLCEKGNVICSCAGFFFLHLRYTCCSRLRVFSSKSLEIVRMVGFRLKV